MILPAPAEAARILLPDVPSSPGAPATRVTYGPWEPVLLLTAGAAGMATACWQGASGALFGAAESSITAGGVLAAGFAAGVWFGSMVPRFRSGRLRWAIVAAMLIAAAVQIAAADWFLQHIPGLYRNARRLSQATPTMTLLAQAAAVAAAFAPGTLLLGAAWGACLRGSLNVTLPRAVAGSVVAAVAGWLVGAALVHWVMPLGAAGMLCVLAALGAAGPAVRRSGGDGRDDLAGSGHAAGATGTGSGGATGSGSSPTATPAGTVSGAPDGTGTTAAAPVAAADDLAPGTSVPAGLALLVLAGAGFAVSAALAMGAIGLPAEAAGWATVLHRLPAGMPWFVGAWAAGFAVCGLTLPAGWLRRTAFLIPPLMTTAAVFLAGRETSRPRALPRPDQATLAAVTQIVDSVQEPVGFVLTVHWDPNRLPPIEGGAGRLATEVRIDICRPTGGGPAAGDSVGPRSVFRVGAGLARDLGLTPDDALRSLPRGYELVLIGDPTAPAEPKSGTGPESATGNPTSEAGAWGKTPLRLSVTSVEHFVRARRLARGTLIQWVRYGRPDDLGPALTAMGAVFGQRCGVWLPTGADGRLLSTGTAVLVAGPVMPRPLDLDRAATRPAGLERLGVTSTVRRWGGLWCTINAEAGIAPWSEFDP